MLGKIYSNNNKKSNNLIICRSEYLFVLVEEDGELADGDAQVGLVELVRNVPANRSELAPLLDQRVEKAQSEQQPLPRRLVGDAREELLVGNRIREVRTEHVETQSCDAADVPGDKKISY